MSIGKITTLMFYFKGFGLAILHLLGYRRKR